MRLAMPTRPLWPLKNSQSSNPVDLEVALTRQAIWDSYSPNTLTLTPTAAGWMSYGTCMAQEVIATVVRWA